MIRRRHATGRLVENFRLDSKCRCNESQNCVLSDSTIAAAKNDRPSCSIRNRLLTYDGIVLSIPQRRRDVHTTRNCELRLDRHRC